MKIFISGTGTDVGKTLICSWLVLHTGFTYFKPIQTGAREQRDLEVVKTLSNTTTYPENYCYQEPCSPHLAASLADDEIDIKKITLPQHNKIIIEGAGGVLVPINNNCLMTDLIKQFNAPVILVAHSHLGTINHTLLSLEALRARNIKILGVIMNGTPNENNKKAIEFYGKTQVLAEFPKLDNVDRYALKNIPLPATLIQKISGYNNDAL